MAAGAGAEAAALHGGWLDVMSLLAECSPSADDAQQVQECIEAFAVLAQNLGAGRGVHPFGIMGERYIDQ